jgi:hypothetical protein
MGVGSLQGPSGVKPTKYTKPGGHVPTVLRCCGRPRGQVEVEGGGKRLEVRGWRQIGPAVLQSRSAAVKDKRCWKLEGRG